MTFERIQALSEVVRRYRSFNPYDETVVIISYDLMHELQAKCVKALTYTMDKRHYFMDAKVILNRHCEDDYLAVAYWRNGKLEDIAEITDEEVKS